MSFDGQINIIKDKIILDVKPSLMSRVRALFPTTNPYSQVGKYTKKVVTISLHSKNAKDIAWLCLRYKLEITNEDRVVLESLSREFDELALKIQNIYNNSNEYDPKDSLELVGKIPRDYQIQALDLFNTVERLLITDEMGTGKTLEALMMLAQAKCRPAVIVLPVHLVRQWKTVISEVLPQAKTHLVKTGDPDFKYQEGVDFFLVTYDKFKKMPNTFSKIGVKTIVGDEIHHIRNQGTDRHAAFYACATKCRYAIGLTGTPVFNRGIELYNIMDALNKGALGGRNSFISEWCSYSHAKMSYEVNDPDLLFEHLIESGLMIRRTRKQLGKYFKPKNVEYIEIDASLSDLKNESNILKQLALGVLSLNNKESSQSARDFNIKLRQATGIAKAKMVAKLADTIIQEKGNVIISGWHRGFWDIMKKELSQYNPVFVTGTESDKQKEQAQIDFKSGESKVFCLSHKSGEGIDGLQYHCSTIIHGEFAWNGMTHEQIDARLDREGQSEFVDIIYPYISDGSDPLVMQIINNKKDVSYKLIGEKFDSNIEEMDNLDFIKQMARDFLRENNVEYDEGLEKDIDEQFLIDVLSKFSHVGASESTMQDNLHELLLTIPNATIHKEYKFSQRSRLDFLVEYNDKKYVIECKSNARNKREAYRQVERYIKEVEPSAVFVVAPWIGVKDFINLNTKVFVLNYMV